jgi:hypothetical protein
MIKHTASKRFEAFFGPKLSILKTEKSALRPSLPRFRQQSCDLDR